MQKKKKNPDATIANYERGHICDFFDEHVVNFTSRDASRREMKQDETVKDPLIDQIKKEIH